MATEDNNPAQNAPTTFSEIREQQKAVSISPRIAGIHTCDRKNHTSDEIKKSIFETHKWIFENRFSRDEIHFSCYEVKK
jgi:hypothetical protein